ncbi:hypothetical protein WJX73_009859 [Symbiochloris irregularis]|uniref:Uncharacterized protein n=1 Tax=Symbiochloris irregularis TaxID=706552 RepID=A0AAW1Q4A0_9CHLO
MQRADWPHGSYTPMSAPAMDFGPSLVCGVSRIQEMLDFLLEKHSAVFSALIEYAPLLGRGALSYGGLLELYEDCHLGLKLLGRGQTWSLMQLEQAQFKQCSFAWRVDHGKIKQHVDKLKTVYYEIWRQRDELARSGICHSHTLDLVLSSMSANRTGGREFRTVHQIWMAINGRPGRESNADYERRVFGW